MEEDIKILEKLKEEKIDIELIETLKTFNKDDTMPYILTIFERNAIENLIKGYKELEEEVERRIEQKVLDYKYVDKNMLRKDIIQRDYIPKSKVREKMNKDINTNEHTILGGRRNGKTLEYGIRLGRIQMCEELLQEGDK